MNRVLSVNRSSLLIFLSVSMFIPIIGLGSVIFRISGWRITVTSWRAVNRKAYCRMNRALSFVNFAKSIGIAAANYRFGEITKRRGLIMQSSVLMNPVIMLRLPGF
ncbi:MAG TPA: hypothetical protein PLS35_16445 [Nitrospira sp.]|uniref:hypothetical protein n=1 Tax=Plasticicumulans sp. TaxID=2307179 RepID=UPI002BB753B9|nr:hypothetical protein [Nitrospira sp.]